MMLRNLFLSIIFLWFMFSCKSNSEHGTKNINSVEKILSLLDSRDTIHLLDLSHKKIKDLPDLSKYKVRRLNISHNNLDTLIMKNLPSYLVDLDVSHNKINGGMTFVNIKKEYYGFYKVENNISKFVREINLSDNEFEGVSFLLDETEIKRIIMANNKLYGFQLYFNVDKLTYLDISNNPKLSNIVSFDPSNIDTIKSKNIAIDAILKFIEPPKIIEIKKTCTLEDIFGKKQ